MPHKQLTMPLLFRSYFLLLGVLLTIALCTELSSSLDATTGTSNDPVMLDRFHGWMSAYGRSYPSPAEKLRRFEVYHHNVDLIDASNKDAERLGYELAENEFTDLTNEEFVARYTGGAPYAGVVAGGSLITTLAGDVTEGMASAESAIHNDGCCWAFSAAATVESLTKIKGGKLVNMSVQELVDCVSTDPFRSPCKTGSPESALRWIKSKGGLVPEPDYPYTAKRGKCTTSSDAQRVGKITDVRSVKLLSEPALAQAVLQTPVAVRIDSSGDVLQSYKSGVYKGPCTTYHNHAVTLVGYGVTGAGEEYWILKNSWGQEWGQKGFFFMRKGADGDAGLCGIAAFGVYPVMD